MAYKKYAAVVTDLAIDKSLDYGIPDSLLDKVVPGVRVAIPIRGKQRYGNILEIKEACEFPNVKPLINIVSEEVVITPDLFELGLWMARWYCAPLSKVLKTILPGTIRRNTQAQKQLFVVRKQTIEKLRATCVELQKSHPAQANVLEALLKVEKGILLSELMEKAKTSRSPIETLEKKGLIALEKIVLEKSPLINEEYFRTKAKILTPEQDITLKALQESLDASQHHTHLIHGITGSGKTEIYLQAIHHALQQNKGAIMLVPEISLTEQMIGRFRSRFEGIIAILHHRLSHGERYDQWSKIRSGQAKIVLGARSAIFSPVQNLGLIIVDEEHEHSYKQSEEAPCYHARDVAVMRGKITNSTVILGSATPSIESYHNALGKKYHLHTLTTRPEASTLPTVTIVDMRKEDEKQKRFATFSDALLQGIKRRYTSGEQTILFLNRRGYHTTLMCQECGHIIKCNHCDVALTYHKNAHALSCHLCGFHTSPPPKQCTKCQSYNTMKFKGTGTEQIEKALNAIIPDIRTIRVDADTTRHKGSHKKLLRDFATGKADVMIGTQMIAKGLHFPEVTLVGVLNCDGPLNIPDFRASETVFQLMTQVAGRAGRGVTPGEVLVQTRMPDNATIQYAVDQDFIHFFEDEIAVREMFSYPPFQRLAKLTFVGTDERKVQLAAEEFRALLATKLPPSFELHPVLPSGHAKIKDHYRFQFLIKGQNMYTLSREIHALDKPRSVDVYVDIDPSSTFF